MAHDWAMQLDLACKVWPPSCLLPGWPRHNRLDIHFSPFPPWYPRYKSSFVDRFANNKEQGIAIYVPISMLVDFGARLATNGVMVCRNKIPFMEISAIFALSGSRGREGRGCYPRPWSTISFAKVRMVKITCGRRATSSESSPTSSGVTINIPFITYRSNVAMILRRVPDMVPNDTQAKGLKHRITRHTCDAAPYV